MSEGAAKRFYQGEVKNFAADPSVIVYYAIQTQLADAKDDSSSIYSNKMPEQDETKYNDIKLTGCRLVGIIPCSDAFGVDLLIEKYQTALQEREEENQEQIKFKDIPGSDQVERPHDPQSAWKQSLSPPLTRLNIDVVADVADGSSFAEGADLDVEEEQDNVERSTPQLTNQYRL